MSFQASGSILPCVVLFSPTASLIINTQFKHVPLTIYMHIIIKMYSATLCEVQELDLPMVDTMVVSSLAFGKCAKSFQPKILQGCCITFWCKYKVPLNWKYLLSFLSNREIWICIYISKKFNCGIIHVLFKFIFLD